MYNSSLYMSLNHVVARRQLFLQIGWIKIRLETETSKKEERGRQKDCWSPDQSKVG